MKKYVIIINGIDAIVFFTIEQAQQAINKLKSYNTNVDITLKTMIKIY